MQSAILSSSKSASLIHSNLKNWFVELSKTPVLNLELSSELLMTWCDAKDALFNTVLSMPELEVKKSVSSVVEHYQSLQNPHCWWVYEGHDPEFLAPFLIERGFSLWGDVRGMALNLCDYEPVSIDTSDIAIEKIREPQLLDDWIKPLVNGFEFSEHGASVYKQIFVSLFHSNKFEHFICRQNGETVASLSIFYDIDGVASIYNCATVESARNQKIMSRLTQHVLNHIVASGRYTEVVLQASPLSYKLFSHIGFKTFSLYRIFSHL